MQLELPHTAWRLLLRRSTTNTTMDAWRVPGLICQPGSFPFIKDTDILAWASGGVWVCSCWTKWCLAPMLDPGGIHVTPNRPGASHLSCMSFILASEVRAVESSRAGFGCGECSL